MLAFNGMLDYFDGTNDLHGVDVRTSVADIKKDLDINSGTFYVMGKVGTLFGFFEYTDDYMPANKAYLLVDGEAAARGLTMVFADEASGILSLSTDSKDAKDASAYYDLYGRKVARPAKGLYIHNGKKVVIK